MTKPRATTPDSTTPDSVYLPDLCRLPVVLAVLLLTQLLVLVYVLSLGALTAFDWSSLATYSLYNHWISLLTLVGWCQARGFINRRNDRVATALCLGWVLLVVLLANIAAQWVKGGRGPMTWDWQWGLRDALIYWVLAAIGLRYLYIIRLWRVEQAASHAAKIDALYARIRPHFLFNSMNTIASLIAYAPEEAEESVEDLSLLLRASMLASERYCLWSEELALCRAYCRIEQQRLGERLSIQWDVGRVPDDFKLPPLIVQPLIENAVYHGIEPLPQGGVINVSAHYESSPKPLMRLQIKNPCKHAGTPSEPGAEDTGTQGSNHQPFQRHSNQRVAAQRTNNGMAIDNIRARLASIYRNPDTLGSEAQLLIEEREHDYVVTLTLPMAVSP